MDNEMTLKRLAEGFRTKDIEAILAEFTDDGVFETFAGPEPCGERYTGKPAIRAALERAFKAPDFSIEQRGRWFAGDRVVSEFRFITTSPNGERVELHGCDLFTLRGGKVLKKDTYLKQRRRPQV